MKQAMESRGLGKFAGKHEHHSVAKDEQVECSQGNDKEFEFKTEELDPEVKRQKEGSDPRVECDQYPPCLSDQSLEGITYFDDKEPTHSATSSCSPSSKCRKHERIPESVAESHLIRPLRTPRLYGWYSRRYRRSHTKRLSTTLQDQTSSSSQPITTLTIIINKKIQQKPRKTKPRMRPSSSTQLTLTTNDRQFEDPQFSVEAVGVPFNQPDFQSAFEMPLDTYFGGNTTNDTSQSIDLAYSTPTFSLSVQAALSFLSSNSADPASTLASSIPNLLNQPSTVRKTYFGGNAARFIHPNTDLELFNPRFSSSAPAPFSFQYTSSVDPASTLGNIASSIPNPLNLPVFEILIATTTSLAQGLVTLPISDPSNPQIAIHSDLRNWHPSQRTDSTMTAHFLLIMAIQVRSLFSLMWQPIGQVTLNTDVKKTDETWSEHVVDSKIPPLARKFLQNWDVSGSSGRWGYIEIQELNKTLSGLSAGEQSTCTRSHLGCWLPRLWTDNANHDHKSEHGVIAPKTGFRVVNTQKMRVWAFDCDSFPGFQALIITVPQQGASDRLIKAKTTHVAGQPLLQYRIMLELPQATDSEDQMQHIKNSVYLITFMSVMALRTPSASLTTNRISNDAVGNEAYIPTKRNQQLSEGSSLATFSRLIASPQERHSTWELCRCNILPWLSGAFFAAERQGDPALYASTCATYTREYREQADFATTDPIFYQRKFVRSLHPRHSYASQRVDVSLPLRWLENLSRQGSLTLHGCLQWSVTFYTSISPSNPY